jgi:hypothetical protein
MSVHVGEVHTEVIPTGGPGGTGPEASREPEWTPQQRAAEERARAGWLQRRVCAEAFDD